MSKRTLKPRQPVAMAAAMISQLTSMPLIGVDERRFLDVVVPMCRDVVVSVGRLRLVPLDIAVERLRATAVGADAEAPDSDVSQPETAAAVLARLGKEVGS